MSGCLEKRWMAGAQRKWFHSLFQILNQPLLQARTADINCDICDFLLPAQIMRVWTTGALAPCPQRPRERYWLWAQWVEQEWFLILTQFHTEEKKIMWPSQAALIKHAQRPNYYVTTQVSQSYSLQCIEQFRLQVDRNQLFSTKELQTAAQHGTQC